MADEAPAESAGGVTEVGEPRPLAVLRRVVLALFVLGALGTLAELILLGHYEERVQLVPMVLLSAAPLSALLRALRPRTAWSLRLFQGLMVCFVVAGFSGIWFHYHGNVEFELEMYPTRSGFELFWESMKGATPTLAPGAMIELGLLGLAYCYRHPLLRRPGV